MNKMHLLKRLTRALLLVLIVVVALAASACEATVGVGVSTWYPGPWGGPWGGGVYVGGPVVYR
jgi:hypothetical protein